MAEPGDGIAAGAGGRSYLRASHAEREQVIGLLKAAFVQERLAKDEFDLRVGRALTSRTLGELTALTADIPAGLTEAQAPHHPQARGNTKTAAALIGTLAAWLSIPAVASFLIGENGPAQGSLSAAIVVALLQVSAVSLWLVTICLKVRARKRSALSEITTSPHAPAT